MITLSTPLWLDSSMMVLRAGMSDSPPSRPNRFSEDHFLWRNSSNLWTGGGAAASHCVSKHLPPPESLSLQLLCILFQLITEVCWGMWGNTDRPCGSDHSGQKSPLLLQTELHDSRCLKLLSDPLALLQVVDEHELHTDVLTVRHLTNQQHRWVLGAVTDEWPVQVKSSTHRLKSDITKTRSDFHLIRVLNWNKEKLTQTRWKTLHYKPTEPETSSPVPE